MREQKKRRLEAKGWKVGTTTELLGLSPEEKAYIEIRLRLAEGLKRLRIQHQVTQSDLAKTIHSSQSRIAKMKAGDPTVSIDLLVRTILALGASSRELADIISGSPSKAA